MKVFSIIFSVVASLVILLRLMPLGWARVEPEGQGPDRLGDEHLHVPVRRR